MPLMADPVTPTIVPAMKLFLMTLDFVGTFVFALSGAIAAVKRELDFFGVLVLSFVAATTGDIIRGVLIGAIPPATRVDWRYLAISLLAGILTFYWFPLIDRLKSPVQLFDAAGLVLFAVSGAQKALAYGLDAPMAALLGMLTGIGGGMARDVLVSEIPTVLRAELYAVAAVAAVAGAGAVVIGESLGPPSTVTTLTGALLCLGLRLGSIYRGWHLPKARPPKSASRDGNRK
ncbi:MAG TPA: trimeric intracellular cation channel family protein [Burkholderiales bacterium]|nr:trimeric intracellular cation channel family protein [Burkholderiales bacterium]